MTSMRTDTASLEALGRRLAETMQNEARDIAPLYGVAQPPAWGDLLGQARLVSEGAATRALGKLDLITRAESRTLVEQAWQAGYEAGQRDLAFELDEGGEDGQGRMLAGALVNRVLHELDGNPYYSVDEHTTALLALLRAWTGLDIVGAAFARGALHMRLRGTQTNAAELLSYFNGRQLTGRYTSGGDGEWVVTVEDALVPVEPDIEVPVDDA